VLRQPCEADTQHIFDAYTQDAEVPRYMTWRPHTVLAESEDFMRKCLSDWNVGHREPTMPEAICTLTEAALGLSRFFRVQAACDVENHQSARALEKSGFVREARLERYIVHPNISSEPRACYIYARCR